MVAFAAFFHSQAAKNAHFPFARIFCSQRGFSTQEYWKYFKEK